MAVLNRTRELCLVSVYVSALTGVAGAADLAVKTPIVAPVPVFSWTGVYLGIGGGTGWGNNEYTWNQGCHVGCGHGPDAKPWNATAAWPNARIASDQWRAFRGLTWRKLAGRAGRFWNPSRRSLG